MLTVYGILDGCFVTKADEPSFRPHLVLLPALVISLMRYSEGTHQYLGINDITGRTPHGGNYRAVSFP